VFWRVGVLTGVRHEGPRPVIVCTASGVRRHLAFHSLPRGPAIDSLFAVMFPSTHRQPTTEKMELEPELELELIRGTRRRMAPFSYLDDRTPSTC
jgi:hypothetical protein